MKRIKSFYPPVCVHGPISNRWYVVADGVWNPVERQYRWEELENMWDKIEMKKLPKEKVSVSKKEWKVKGSKGNTYSVVNDRGFWTCSCPAHSFRRGDCKHIKQIQNEASKKTNKRKTI